MSYVICFILIIGAGVSKDTNLFIAAGLFAIGGEISSFRDALKKILKMMGDIGNDITKNSQLDKDKN